MLLEERSGVGQVARNGLVHEGKAVALDIIGEEDKKTLADERPVMIEGQSLGHEAER